ncbi:type II secretion system F family protein [Candidatus Peregrinibacteria bacterium]|nr:type II secretion system F family protein [Candidatus Peregrinibacteria bacterium]
MATRQTKGFYKNIEGKETYQVGDQDKAAKKPETDASIVMDISSEKKNLKRIFLNKEKGLTKLTGNVFVDNFNKLNDWIIEHNKVKIQDLATMFRLLAVMINAGIPLIKSLNTLALQMEKNPKLQKTLFDLAKSVENGQSLSSSMGDHTDIFSDAQVGAVKAGEESGQLNKTLVDLASELEKTASISGKVKGALIYPIVIICIMIAVIILMMTLVVPQLSELFTSSGKELPMITQYMISTSNFIMNYWWALLLGVIGFFAGVGFWKSTKTGKYWWDFMMLKIPIFGKLIQKSALSKFSHSFGNLLSSGVPIVKSMEIVAAGMGNEVYRKRFLLTAEDMKAGIPIAENLSSSSLFPSMLVNMVEVGEQTAQLENVMKKVADFYDDEVDTAVKALTKIMEPLIIVLVGITVGGLVAAIMLPIMQLTDLTETIV